MKNNELMRGDFVMFFDDFKIGHKAKVDQILRNSCLLLYNATKNDKYYADEILVNYGDIHPIELTENIVKKLGFEALSDDVFFYKIEGFFGMSLVRGGNGEWTSGSVKVKYVHELMQLMRMLGIQIEIVDNTWEK